MHADSYYAATQRDRRGFTTLDGDLETDIAIVGGGFTGISAALEFVERGQSVVVLEARTIGWGASGRNGGQITGSLSGETTMLRAFKPSLGPDAEAYVWALRWRGHDIIRRRIEQYDIACDLAFGHIQAALKPAHMRDLEAFESEAQRHGMSDHLTLLDRSGIRNYLGTKIYIGGLLNRNNMHVHALDLCVGEARAAERLGARIFEGAEVQLIEHGERPRLVTKNGSVRTKQVLIAGNAFHLLEQKDLGGRLFPVSLANMATEPLSEATAQEINPDNLAVYDCRFVLDYYRLTADRRLMFGGGVNYSGRPDKDVIKALRPAMERTFPQLKGMAIDYAWNCQDGITANRIPEVGRLSKNVFYLQGYSGHGIALTHVMANIVSDAMLEDTAEFDLFANVRHLKLPFARTLGCQFQAVGMQFYALRDWLRT